MFATLQLQSALERYWSKYHDVPKTIFMSLRFYNMLCQEDVEGVINATNETIFGIYVVLSDDMSRNFILL